MENIDYLCAALRGVDIGIKRELMVKILDVVNLVDEKGGETSIMDLAKLEVKWINDKKENDD